MDDQRLPRIVNGVVTRHEPFGFFVDIDEHAEGLVVITLVSDDAPLPNPEFPRVGAEVEAVLIGYTDIGHQPRLSCRPGDLAAYRTGPEASSTQRRDFPA